ncbi:MAG: DUF6288 domain-containing protein, partial [Planctomycetota bacterium]
MKKMTRLIVCIVLLAAGVSCSNERSGSETGTPDIYPDPSVTRFTNLGFLGAEGYGLTRTLTLIDERNPDKPHYPGGVVINAFQNGSLLEAAGLQTGDVVVQVAGDFLPSKENPSWDMLKRMEAALSAGMDKIELGFWRKGKVHKASLDLSRAELPPLVPGNIQACERYRAAARKGISYLAGIQQDNGSFSVARSTPDSELAVVSLAGLAFLASASLDEADPYKENVKKCAEYIKAVLEAEKAGHLGGAYAFIFLSEYMDRTHDMELMQRLVQIIPLIMEAQQEDGRWLLCEKEKEAALGYSEQTLATCLELTALGCAERSGVIMSDNSPIEKACAFLKARTQNGNVGYIPDPAFDRRSEAGRLAGVLFAMSAISCSYGDGYMQKLFTYYSDLSKEIPMAKMDEAVHLLSSALLSRQKDLPQWCQFNEEHGVLLLSLQRLDGSFAELPKADKREIPFYSDCQGEAWRASIYTLIFLLQEDALPKFMVLHASEVGVDRDSDGKRMEGASSMPGLPEGMDNLPPGAQTFTFTSEEEAMEVLKKMGIDQSST